MLISKRFNTVESDKELILISMLHNKLVFIVWDANNLVYYAQSLELSKGGI